MKLTDLPTPSLVLDRGILLRNIAGMGEVARRHGIALRPHMKTAKSAEIARLATAGHSGAITVSTLAEAEYFTAHGSVDILYAVGVTPDKLDKLAALKALGADPMVITDDLDVARAITSNGQLRCLIEIDSGEERGGLAPDDPMLPAIAYILGPHLAGVMTHGGFSYAARSPDALADAAAAERRGVVHAAERLRAAGFVIPIVSLGSTPTALHASSLEGVTELRAGVYMFGDLFQAAIGAQEPNAVALSVLTSIIGRRPSMNRLLIDAGALALSKDRSTGTTDHDVFYGQVLDIDGKPLPGPLLVGQVYQEHGVITGPADGPSIDRPIGTRLRIAPNHACLTAAAHDRYHVVEGRQTVEAIWTRVNGW